MKRLIVCLLLAANSIAGYAQNAAKARLSPLTQQYLLNVKKAGGNAHLPGYIYKHFNNEIYISAIIKVNGDPGAALHALNIRIGTKAGNIWTVQVPVAGVAQFISVAGISYIQLDEPAVPTLDKARLYTHVDSATAGIGLPMSVTGQNVIVGIIDAGFDYTHPTLYDTTNSAYRVRRVWAQKSAGTPPTGFIYGNEMTDSNVIRSANRDTAILSHGTHVAGIATGSGFGSNGTNNKFRGMAFGSDIVLVGIMPAPSQWENTGESDIIDGMSYIYTYAASVNKPAVINLSWGATLGPHDGASLFSQACDNLTGAGKLFVCAAGNNGADTVHLQHIFTAADTLVHTFATFSPYLATKNTWVDMWGDTGKSFCLNVRLYNGNNAIDSTGFVCLDNGMHSFNLIGANNDTCFATITTSTSEFNDKPRLFLTLYSKTPDNICLSVKATDGSVHMWEGYVAPPEGYYGYLESLGYPWAVSGNSDYTVSDIGCTKSAITTGAYVSKTAFTNISNQSLYYPGAVLSHIASFSSHGPTADNRIKPDITAPGFALASSINSFDTSYLPAGQNYGSVISDYVNVGNGRTYSYAMLAGTSMASPCTAGIAALMLQVNPHLTPDEAKQIIAATAIQDTYTGTLPAAGTDVWGHGKINAYRAVLQALQTNGVAQINNPLECMLYPNPNKGMFTISYVSTQQQQLSITVYDISGRLVHAQQWKVSPDYNQEQMNLSSLSKGIYFTKISGTGGSSVIKTVIE